jgi:HTH-type transcriptional regulator/antitoxin HigA
MNISQIKTQRDYRNALKDIEGLMSAKRNTPEGDRLDVLVTLVEAWELKHYPMSFATLTTPNSTPWLLNRSTSPG